MAPIFATATGVTLQELSEPLKSLLAGLTRVEAADDVPALLQMLDEACESWVFYEEQVRV
jgi:hypothetical protein